MGISAYLKEIGRGKEGARSLSREQAADLMGQVLDDQVSDLELGAFCIAMRVKGESPDEMAGFIDATESRLQRLPASASPLVVLPSYNGARKLPLLTPLLGLLLAREGLPVLIHGAATESARIHVEAVLAALGIAALQRVRAVAPGELAYAPTALLSPSLLRLLEVRRTIGLRNPAHSLVKQLNPCAGDALRVASYTHPEYAASMAEVFGRTGASGLLLRGTEGEPVADPRRLPAIRVFHGGALTHQIEAQPGSLATLPALPESTAADAAANYTRAVLEGRTPVPAPIAQQVECIVQLHAQMQAQMRAQTQAQTQAQMPVQTQLSAAPHSQPHASR